MAFVNTVDVYGDVATMDMIINRTIVEYRDDSNSTIGDRAFTGCSSRCAECDFDPWICFRGNIMDARIKMHSSNRSHSP